MLRRIIISLGAFVAILPYLGLPHAWDSVLFTLSGLTVIVLLLLSRRPSSQSRIPSSSLSPRDTEKDAASPRVFPAKHIAVKEKEERPTIIPETAPVFDRPSDPSGGTPTQHPEGIASAAPRTVSPSSSSISTTLSGALDTTKSKSAHPHKKRRSPSSLLAQEPTSEEKV